MRKQAAAAILAAALGGPPVTLLAETVTIENNTGFPICEAYFSPAAAELWITDVLGGRCFSQGRAVTLDLNLDQRAYDLLIIAQGGLGRTYYGLDVRQYRHVRLNVADADLFEWDPSAAP